MDTEFIPVFGMPFDSMQNSSLGKDIYDAIRKCKFDIMTGNHVRLLSNVLNNTIGPSGFNYEKRSIIIDRVVETRIAIDYLNSVQSELKNTSDHVDVILKLSEAKDRFNNAQISLMPSRKKEIHDSVLDALSAKAEKILEIELESKIRGTPQQVLEYIHSVMTVPSQLLIHLIGSTREKFLIKLKRMEEEVSNRIFHGQYEKAKTLSADLNGVKLLDELRDGIPFNLMSTPVKSPLETTWTKLRDENLQEAINREIAPLIDAPHAHSELKRGAEWFQNFKERWRSYVKEEGFQKGLRMFFADRQKRLFSGLIEYHKRVSQNESPAMLRDEFLILEEDKRNPIALEYDLVAAGVSLAEFPQIAQ